ncbi:hypothetical protein [Actinoplanes couchii]|uniref:Uncharacterized protein n=1 Tax=Actinoplanes couchii TaxID=403638 RepID=A0ABQ3XU36_9ACTN|nr:hypothetical protein [Actinoplanes couchii]MDR6317354.1 hypothetical protein [Actinoplanes couchii]GID62027.1 hypothetical protein Aco03nite_104310 [Actinoplanes couchii]
MTIDELGWAPETCTLPTASKPLRVAEFDDLLTSGLLSWQRLSSTALTWQFSPSAMPAARDLTTRESACCTFFTFTFHGPRLTVTVPGAQTGVLDALEERSAALLRRSS